MSLVQETGGPRHRAGDPITSQIAAEVANLKRSHDLVIHLLSVHGPLAVFELQERAYRTWGPRIAAPSRFSSCMTELERQGVVRLVPGVFRVTPFGRPAQVWELV